MVNRTKISKEIRRRTGGAGQYKPPTAAEVRKKAAQQKTNLSQDEWEIVPGSNPPKYRMKKEAKIRRRNKFEAEQAKKREKVTDPAVKALYKSAAEGAPYARLTGAVRRGAKKAQLDRDIASRDIDDYPSQPRNRAIIDELKRLEKEKAMGRRRRVGEADIATRTVGERLPTEINPATAGLYKQGGKVSKSKGGTVKKKHGGKLHKTRKTYGGHDGNKYVSKLYK